MALASGDVLASYAFEFEVEGISIAQFSQVSGLTVSVAVIEHRACKKGGLQIHRKMIGPASPGDVVLKKGKTTDNELYNWFHKTQNGQFSDARRNASIILFDYENGEVVRYNLESCWVSKFSLGDLAAGSSTALFEEVVIVHEGVTLA